MPLWQLWLCITCSVSENLLRPDFNGENAAMKLFNLLDKDSSGEITLEEVDLVADRTWSLSLFFLLPLAR